MLLTTRGFVVLFALFAIAVHGHIKQHRTLVKSADVDVNCTKTNHETSDFPADLFTVEERRSGAILLHILCGLYCFIIIAFVCNDYFLPSVDCICQDLNLSKDVAGATFMAFATSAPELFVNVIGTFLTESDLGVGTVVGSAVFNTLGVAACSGLAAKTMIPLEVWPLSRDCGIYAFVVASLTLILWDGKVEWYEALVLLVLYLIYCFLLFCQQRLHKAAKSVLESTNSFSSQSSTVALAINSHMSTGTYRPYHHHGEVIGWEKRPSTIKPEELKSVEMSNCKDKDEEIEYEAVQVCLPPEGCWKKFWWFVSWPVAFSLYVTIPDCRTNRKVYPATFFMCIIWIGLSSYLVSWMMTIVGDTMGISDSVMGLTLVAIGGSMPEASTSIINARLGIASMTISNALGGNTLDILLSLGLPWFIKCLVPESLNGGPVIIESSGLFYNNAAQLACVGVLFLSAAANSFRMDKKLGLVCLVMYMLFIGFIVMVEVDVFHLREPQPC
ncbi:sodium/potassium/calcium exchanger 3-like isoform X1 [Cimex lectularius]|uniref:Sodium/calcium exchanger membrane region domain-containing protein n=1 Tax=Cimex lectularius TaxID=79782 RepID=A0A8I6SJ59_CIMLE|nr:sodium/potassium/calcium exchanger 3-like isoform X1 [Cimex lectularius]